MLPVSPLLSSLCKQVKQELIEMVVTLVVAWRVLFYDKVPQILALKRVSAIPLKHRLVQFG